MIFTIFNKWNKWNKFLFVDFKKIEDFNLKKLLEYYTIV